MATVVCLIGSTRFRAEYARAFYEEEHAGRICLTAPCYKDDPCCKTAEDHARLDALHLEKIDLASEVYLINPRVPVCDLCNQPVSYDPKWGGFTCWLCQARQSEPREVAYVGESTRRELEYARGKGKKIRSLEPLE